MPKRIYALPHDQNQHLEISWQSGWQSCTIHVQHRWVGFIPRLKTESLSKHRFLLQDGSWLEVSLAYSGAVPADLAVSVDGQLLRPIPNPRTVLTLSCGGIFAVAGGHLLIGLQLLTTHFADYGLTQIAMAVTGLFLPLGFANWLNQGSATIGIAAMSISAVFFYLGMRVWRRDRNAWAIAFALYSLDTVSFAWFGLTGSGETLLIAGLSLGVRLGIVTAIAAGFTALETPVSQTPSFSSGHALFRASRSAARGLLAVLRAIPWSI